MCKLHRSASCTVSHASCTTGIWLYCTRFCQDGERAGCAPHRQKYAYNKYRPPFLLPDSVPTPIICSRKMGLLRLDEASGKADDQDDQRDEDDTQASPGHWVLPWALARLLGLSGSKKEGRSCACMCRKTTVSGRLQPKDEASRVVKCCTASPGCCALLIKRQPTLGLKLATSSLPPSFCDFCEQWRRSARNSWGGFA